MPAGWVMQSRSANGNGKRRCRVPSGEQEAEWERLMMEKQIRQAVQVGQCVLSDGRGAAAI